MARPRKVTPDLYGKVASLRYQGYTAAEVGRALGLSRATIYRALSEGGAVSTPLRVAIVDSAEVPVARYRQRSVGSPSPLSYELSVARLLGIALRRPLVLAPMEFPDILPSVRSGRVHLGLGTVGITRERRRVVEFSDPYAPLNGQDIHFYYVDERLPDGLPYGFFGDKSVGVTAGSLHEWFLRQTYPAARAVVFRGTKQALSALEAGRLDAILEHEYSVPDGSGLKASRGFHYGIEPGVAVNRESPQLVEAVNLALRDLKNSQIVCALAAYHLHGSLTGRQFRRVIGENAPYLLQNEP